ncbi:MAG: hypothetical protein R6U95_03460 [Bacteroidales bacterium]
MRRIVLYFFIASTASIYFGCSQSTNEWNISGFISEYNSQPVYLSIRGNVDSTYTNEQGEFVFSRKKQKPEFVRLSLYSDLSSPLHLFADSVCDIQIAIDDTAHMHRARIQNSPESVLLQELYTWHEQRKIMLDSLREQYQKNRQVCADVDSLRDIYMSEINVFHEENTEYLCSFISHNTASPVAATASFMTFDTVTYKPLLLQDSSYVTVCKDVHTALEKRYGNVPFVDLYAKTIRAINRNVDAQKR